MKISLYQKIGATMEMRMNGILSIVVCNDECERSWAPLEKTYGRESYLTFIVFHLMTMRDTAMKFGWPLIAKTQRWRENFGPHRRDFSPMNIRGYGWIVNKH